MKLIDMIIVNTSNQTSFTPRLNIETKETPFPFICIPVLQ